MHDVVGFLNAKRNSVHCFSISDDVIGDCFIRIPLVHLLKKRGVDLDKDYQAEN